MSFPIKIKRLDIRLPYIKLQQTDFIQFHRTGPYECVILSAIRYFANDNQLKFRPTFCSNQETQTPTACYKKNQLINPTKNHSKAAIQYVQIHKTDTVSCLPKPTNVTSSRSNRHKKNSGSSKILRLSGASSCRLDDGGLGVQFSAAAKENFSSTRTKRPNRSSYTLGTRNSSPGDIATGM